MIYLDYAADTPVDRGVLDVFNEITKNYIANPNSNHKLGLRSQERLEQSTEKIATLLGITSKQIIYTSGASESNNLAIKGIADRYKSHGKHIITTFLEHSSVNGPMAYLQNNGFEVDYVDILNSGQVDLEHLKSLIRKDTILISIGYVDSELGIIQPIDEIARLLKEYPNCFFHVDATQAIGKIKTSFDTIDLVTFSGHKFYGLNGCGVLIKKEHVMLEPLIHGGLSTTIYRSGTPTLALIASLEKALTLAMTGLEKKYNDVLKLNKRVRDSLKKYPMIHINSPETSSPFILNISFKGIRSIEFQQELEEVGVYVSTKSACTPVNAVSKPVYAITKDRKLAISPLRISISHLTTEQEIDSFLECFDLCYKKLVK